MKNALRNKHPINIMAWKAESSGVIVQLYLLAGVVVFLIERTLRTWR